MTTETLDGLIARQGQAEPRDDPDPELLGHLARTAEGDDREVYVDLLPGRVIRSSMRARLGSELLHLSWSAASAGTHRLTFGMRGEFYGPFESPRDLPIGTRLYLEEREIGRLAKPAGSSERELVVQLDEVPEVGDRVRVEVEAIKDGKGEVIRGGGQETLTVSKVEPVPPGTVVVLGNPQQSGRTAIVRGLDGGGAPQRHPVGTPLLSAPEHPRVVSATAGLSVELAPPSASAAPTDRAGWLIVTVGAKTGPGRLGELRFGHSMAGGRWVPRLTPLVDDQGHMLPVAAGQVESWGVPLWLTSKCDVGVYVCHYQLVEDDAMPLSRLRIAEMMTATAGRAGSFVASEETGDRR